MKPFIIILTLISLCSCFETVNSENSIVSKSRNEIDTLYTANGNRVRVSIRKDSLIIQETEYVIDNQSVLDTITGIRTKYDYESPGALGGKWTEYYSNGNIRAQGQSANQFGCWMNVGAFKYYDVDGVLLRILTYDNWLENEIDGCHLTIVNMSLIEYYPNGNIKAEKYYQSGYDDITFEEFYKDSQWEEEYKSENWKFYDIDGKVLKEEKYRTRWRKLEH